LISDFDWKSAKQGTVSGHVMIGDEVVVVECQVCLSNKALGGSNNILLLFYIFA